LRRAVIEALYRKINGSLDGLETKLNPALSLNTPNTIAGPAQPQAQSVENQQGSNRTNALPDAVAGDTTPTSTPANETAISADVKNSQSAQTGAPPSKATESRFTPATAKTESSSTPQQHKDACKISVNQKSLTISNNGGAGYVTLSADGLTDPAKILATTPDWSEIAVFLEPKTNADESVFKYSITSVSKRTGTFSVNFKSPCGTQELSVTVQ
jgi:hypothetical protein